MKILYVASDQRVPGRTGGSVHVEEVARGLSAMGHDVHVVALAGDDDAGAPAFAMHPSPMRFEHRVFRWTARRGIERLISEIGFDAVMERYYNFAGEGIRAAHARGIPSILEVNAPLKEHPGSLKNFLDTLAIVRPMKRLRDEICRKASAIVTPLPSIIPDDVPEAKVHRVNWGANVERFHPGASRKALPIPERDQVVVFSGSFRPWHGADFLVRVAARVDNAFFLFVGAGPSWRQARTLAEELGLRGRTLFVGAVRYEEMPSYLKWGTVGVAPYQPARLSQMQLGFYWSPLKIFEYMGMGLPVVTLDTPPLREIVRPGQEGLLVAEGDVEATADAITSLLRDPEAAQAMGQAGRQRVVDLFSWKRHCEALDRILTEVVAAP